MLLCKESIEESSERRSCPMLGPGLRGASNVPVLLCCRVHVGVYDNRDALLGSLLQGDLTIWGHGGPHMLG